MMGVMNDRWENYESLTVDVINSSLQEWEGWIKLDTCGEDVPEQTRAQQTPRIEAPDALSYNPKTALITNTKNVVRKDISPKVQPRDKTPRKKLESVPEIQTRNQTAMRFPSGSHQQHSNLRGEEPQRPNLPDLSYGEQ